jgi:hypothetical protein
VVDSAGEYAPRRDQQPKLAAQTDSCPGSPAAKALMTTTEIAIRNLTDRSRIYSASNRRWQRTPMRQSWTVTLKPTAMQSGCVAAQDPARLEAGANSQAHACSGACAGIKACLRLITWNYRRKILCNGQGFVKAQQQCSELTTGNTRRQRVPSASDLLGARDSGTQLRAAFF